MRFTRQSPDDLFAALILEAKREGYAAALADGGIRPTNDAMAERFRQYDREKALAKYPDVAVAASNATAAA